MSPDCLCNFIDEIKESADLRVVQVSIRVTPKIVAAPHDFKEACLQCVFLEFVDRIIW